MLMFNGYYNLGHTNIYLLEFTSFNLSTKAEKKQPIKLKAKQAVRAPAAAGEN